MTTIHRNDGTALAQPRLRLSAAGGHRRRARPMSSLELCAVHAGRRQVVTLTHAMRGAILDQNRDMARAVRSACWAWRFGRWTRFPRRCKLRDRRERISSSSGSWA